MAVLASFCASAADHGDWGDEWDDDWEYFRLLAKAPCEAMDASRDEAALDCPNRIDHGGSPCRCHGDDDGDLGELVVPFDNLCNDQHAGLLDEFKLFYDRPPADRLDDIPARHVCIDTCKLKECGHCVLIWPLFDLIFHLSIVMMRRTGHQPHGNTF